MPANHAVPVALLLFAFFLISVGTEAEALTDRRYLEVTISNQKGEGVEEVKVLLTSDEQPNFREEQETNKKGEAVLSVVDATKNYELRLEAEALQLADTRVTIRVSNTDGSPADDVMVTVTCEELPDLPKKGSGTVSFTHAPEAYRNPPLVIYVALAEILD